MAAALALPEPLRAFAGRITDVDTHELIPAQQWEQLFGPEVRPLMQAWITKAESDEANRNSPNVPGFPGDILPIDETVAQVKGARAPGAADPTRRTAVMDMLGICRQLMFPTFIGLFGVGLQITQPTEFMPGLIDGRDDLARRTAEAYNRWAAEEAASDRVRPVIPLHAPTAAELIAMARRELTRGIRAIMLPAGIPPAGLSPAHPDLDPLWALLSESDCPLLLHIGCEGRFLASAGWNAAPAFQGFRNMDEFNVDPWSLSVLHLPFQNFVATMITGGVFHRYPHLRMGVIEVGAHWVGPMMRALDLWYANSRAFMKSGETYRLPEPPSAYVRRNLRVSPYVFEDSAALIAQYALEDVLCFSTDYPHAEGGRRPLQSFYDNIASLGTEVLEKFFVTNGELLLPA